MATEPLAGAIEHLGYSLYVRDERQRQVDHSNTANSQESEVFARHATMMEALDGQRELTWDIWASPLCESNFLTPDGQHVVEWAVGVLRTFLGEDFLQRVRKSGMGHALLSPALLTTLWPIIDSRRVYEDILQLALQLSICFPGGKGRRALQKIMSKNFDQTSWTHCLIQLELAALAQRQGGVSEFEHTLSTGTPGDVKLQMGDQTVAIEVTSVGMSVPEQQAAEYFHTMSMLLWGIEMQHGVCIRGDVGDVVPQEERDDWLSEIEVAARSTEQDELERYVSGPAEAAIWVSKEALRPNETHLVGPAGSTDIWGRLNARISLKGRKTVESGPTWIRLQEHAGLWLSMLQPHSSFRDRVVGIAPRLRFMFDQFPHVEGVILSPGPIWLDDDPIEQTITLSEAPGVVALRRPFAQARVRETIIVSRSNQIDQRTKVFVDLYDQAGSWLEWALEKLGQPKLDVIFK